MSCGKEFNIHGNIIKSCDLTYNDLVYLSDNFYDQNKSICRRDYKNKNNLPSIDTVLRILHSENISYYDFIKRYKNPRNRKRTYDLKMFDTYVNMYKNISLNQSKPLSTREFYSKGLPPARWFIKNCPDKEVKNWSDFMRWCEFIPHDNYKYIINNKEYVINSLRNYEKELGRPILLRDVTIKNIGFSWDVIYKIWDSFEECKIDAGLMCSNGNTHKSWDYYNTMMLTALNNIYAVTGNKNITWKDFIDYKNIPLSKDGFIDACSRENIDIHQYFESQGFRLINKSGSGYVTRFSDGEICKSSYERKLSQFLRDNNISYRRNVKYKTLGGNLVDSNIDCDYKLHDKIWVEICGMLRATDEDWKTKQFDNNIQQKYQIKMLEKEKILNSFNAPYIFLFQKDFDNGSFKNKILNILRIDC